MGAARPVRRVVSLVADYQTTRIKTWRYGRARFDGRGTSKGAGIRGRRVHRRERRWPRCTVAKATPKEQLGRCRFSSERFGAGITSDSKSKTNLRRDKRSKEPEADIMRAIKAAGIKSVRRSQPR